MREQSNQRDWNNPKDHVLTIGVSTRALFDMEKEHEIFLEKGARAYVEYELAHERDVLAPGPAFRLIQAFLRLNETDRQSDRQGAKGRRDSGAGRKDCMKENGEEPIRRTEVVIMSKNSAEAALRIFHSIEHYGLDIKKAALTTGAPIAPYLKAYHVDLYLSANEEDVRGALDCGVAAGLILRPEEPKQLEQSEDSAERTGAGSGVWVDGGEENGSGVQSRIAVQRGSGEEISQIRIAFDGDAVLFSGEAEEVFRREGVEAFCRSEKEKAAQPLERGPFANFLTAVSRLQRQYPPEEAPIRTALVTARSAPAHERVIRTLQSWGVRIDEAFFLGGMEKKRVLQAFGAHIFFDDNEKNTREAAKVVLAVRVPGKGA